MKLGLISHHVLVGDYEVLVQLVVECLPGYLHADTQHDCGVYNILFECSKQDLPVALAVLLDWVVGLVLGLHDLVQVDVVVKVVIPLESFEWLQHLVYLVLELLDKVLVINPELALG